MSSVIVYSVTPPKLSQALPRRTRVMEDVHGTSRVVRRWGPLKAAALNFPFSPRWLACWDRREAPAGRKGFRQEHGERKQSHQVGELLLYSLTTSRFVSADNSRNKRATAALLLPCCCLEVVTQPCVWLGFNPIFLWANHILVSCAFLMLSCSVIQSREQILYDDIKLLLTDLQFVFLSSFK